MAKVRIELDSDGIRELLRSPQMEKVCDEQAQRMTRATGMKYERDIHIGRYRVRAGAYSNDQKAAQRDVCPKCGVKHPGCDCNT